MNKSNGRPTFKLWEHTWYVLVTVGLLLVGSVLWLVDVIDRIMKLVRR